VLHEFGHQPVGLLDRLTWRVDEAVLNVGPAGLEGLSVVGCQQVPGLGGGIGAAGIGARVCLGQAGATRSTQNQHTSGSIVGSQVRHDAGRLAGGRGMRLLSSVGRPELVAPVVQRNIGVWVGLGLIAVIVGLDIVGGGRAELLGLLVGPPIVAASFVGPKRTVGVGVAALAAAIGYGRAVGVDLLAGSQGVPAVAIGAATVLSGLVARVRVEREGRLRAVTRVAEVAQRALLGGVPPALGSLRLAVLYASASAEASIGGDFYEALETPHGVRLLVGDVRGKGLDAVRLTGVVLGSFRDAAQEHPDLAQVVAALDRSVTRAIGPEDFVTAVLVQILTDGSAIVLNCGHPAPLLVHAGRATELDPPEPAPPLGLGPRPEPLRLRLALGDRILLYTDGASEARARGGFFPLQAAAAFALVAADLQAGLETLWAELQRHVAGQLHDDIALLLIERSS
jgi:phosphoserine phosphatase RsbU/P